ncbi:TSUP family transporter [Terrilactibacillus sp. BCM23-1]|uniref:Probable membrane transporter protein n=1 Tax=Terrilactibacillus tamarindi TaxID=2599694 RepID=A0A6N8CM23_9BACI|nr:sulfite exporter TauE/SafE family protein [Terrilactibacillus tamarindi]MTT30911.1 TSUP family transporter [Terrilactibacillus tamarindi]
MQKIIIFAFIGLIAQLIDGSLGMAYGVSSTSLLLAFGIAPAVASTSIHMAEVVTTAASGISHIRFGNVDRQTVLKLTIPGAIGAFIGACFLSGLPGHMIKPYVSLFLIVLGLYVLFRFIFYQKKKQEKESINLNKKQSISIGFIAGFADATGGGGWGPLTTPILLSKKGTSVRKVVGTVDTSEFAVSVAATVGFLISLGWKEVDWKWVLALMLGGLIAAPIAAWLVRKLPSYLLGVLVGGLIILTNVWTLLGTWKVDEMLILGVYIVLLVGWGFAIVYAYRRHKRHRDDEHLNS